MQVGSLRRPVTQLPSRWKQMWYGIELGTAYHLHRTVRRDHHEGLLAKSASRCRELSVGFRQYKLVGLTEM